MRLYRRTKLLLACLLAVYFAGGAFGYGVYRVFAGPPKVAAPAEVFPFYDWAMFAFIFVVQKRFVILVQELGGRRFDPPRDLALLADTRGEGAHYLIDRMGHAAQEGREDDLRAMNDRLKALLAPPARYELAEETYDPLARWRGSSGVGRAVLRSYSWER